jgi:hypothetical protein
MMPRMKATKRAELETFWRAHLAGWRQSALNQREYCEALAEKPARTATRRKSGKSAHSRQKTPNRRNPRPRRRIAARFYTPKTQGGPSFRIAPANGLISKDRERPAPESP